MPFGPTRMASRHFRPAPAAIGCPRAAPRRRDCPASRRAAGRRWQMRAVEVRDRRATASDAAHSRPTSRARRDLRASDSASRDHFLPKGPGPARGPRSRAIADLAGRPIEADHCAEIAHREESPLVHGQRRQATETADRRPSTSHAPASRSGLANAAPVPPADSSVQSARPAAAGDRATRGSARRRQRPRRRSTSH